MSAPKIASIAGGIGAGLNFRAVARLNVLVRAVPRDSEIPF
jgi:hypothetical protein